ncbi:hypothetical protein V1477_014980 [Vespula maculifrons]|uniref:Uncharacterized protein n=1 Tax=Vespula maculifrons TaxID=7453 RepID=A0ABD2BIZ9_VESMC
MEEALHESVSTHFQNPCSNGKTLELKNRNRNCPNMYFGAHYFNIGVSMMNRRVAPLNEKEEQNGDLGESTPHSLEYYKNH